MNKTISESLSTLVAWNKKIIDVNETTRRWLADGEIINLSVNKRTSKNVEFKVNNDDNHLIWFSQFSAVLLRLSDLKLVSGEIKLKDGKTLFLCNIQIDDFIEIIKNKTFKVICNEDGAVANFEERNPPCRTYTAYVDLIRELVNRGELDKAASYLSPTREYSLIEI